MPVTPAPKKKKTGLIIGVAAVAVAVIVACVIIFSGGGDSEKGSKTKNTAEAVALKAASYLAIGDADALVDYTSDTMMQYGADEYFYGNVESAEDSIRDSYKYYTEFVNESISEGVKITYEIVDSEKTEDLDEIQEEFGDYITDAYSYTVMYYFEFDGYTDEENVDIIVWENDGKWEFVMLDN